ncbi:uncharacterized protein LOC135843544 [Planococcus citri]|uniref:uncharacterized protein LOC135843544 n=1 Tax=Planococcus citri TaxID=170843 RepID=UPI0031F8B984
MNANKECDKDLLKELDLVIRSINPYAKSYKMLKTLENEEISRQSQNSETTVTENNVSMMIRQNRTVDCRRYNLPNCSEVAVIFKNNDGAPPFQRDIRIYPKSENNDTFININSFSCNLDPMCYTLMFPYGEPGWEPNMLSNIQNDDEKEKHITMLQYKKSKLSITTQQQNPLLNYGKLLQQYVVDSYVQVEANRLNFVRNHQKDLRVESYTGLMDYMRNKTEENACEVGKQIILPSSFEGSPRNMREKYLDAMSIVSTCGSPDLFITFTCNPKWPEISDNLLYSQSASDRPDLVCRVFSLKHKELIHDIVENKIFGEVSGYVYTIEFQKRGLPHAHMLFILKDKILSSEMIDRFVSAEIPDPKVYPALHEIVKNNMIHGPCGAMKPNAYCMENGKCVKGFPKTFHNETCMDRAGYPSYRRRNDIEITKNGVTYDNRYVVPYNKYLSKKYNAHINVEVCTTVKSVKYIFKYIYKGYDCACIKIMHQGTSLLLYDEIESYLDCRYISACEAAWRLFEFKLHDRSHSVIRLQVHLPDEQNVMFKKGNEEIGLQRTKSTLLAWFELNKKNDHSRKYKYTEIPQHYVFNKSNQVQQVMKISEL